jgi:hypothetical protein
MAVDRPAEGGLLILVVSNIFMKTTRVGDVQQSSSASLLSPPCIQKSPIKSSFSFKFNQLLTKKELVSEKRMVKHKQEP